MSWINQHQRNWRIALLVLMVAAFLGPWTFDLINVPSEYECSAPFIRLEGDFCGDPISGIWLYPWVVISFFSTTIGMISGNLVFTEWISGFLIFIPILPIFSTLLLILRGDHPRRQVFTIIAWILAIGIGLFWGMSNSNYPRLFWAVWGIWFYIGLAISALILEILVILSNRKDLEGLTDIESELL